MKFETRGLAGAKIVPIKMIDKMEEFLSKATFRWVPDELFAETRDGLTLEHVLLVFSSNDITRPGGLEVDVFLSGEDWSVHVHGLSALMDEEEEERFTYMDNGRLELETDKA